MRRLLRFGLVVTCFVSACAVSDGLWAQKGRGGGGGWKGGGAGPWSGGGFQPGGNRGGGRHFRGPSWSGGNFDGLPGRGGLPSARGPFGWDETSPLAPSSQFGGGHALDRQRWNEERKLEHRRNVADHLRGVSERNGNENLNDVADRMDQQAQDHYDRRREMLDRRDGFPDYADEVLPGADEALDQHAHPEQQATDAARNLTGVANARYRQLQNEERKLNQRMATVERLNQLYEQTSDPRYWDAAQRLESLALEHYEKRLEKIAEFPQP
jgi:hypothetical protein